MKLFQVNIVTLMLRFYLLMGIVIVAFFAGIPWLSFLALPVFLSAMMGIQFSGVKRSRKPSAAPQTSIAFPHQALHA